MAATLLEADLKMHDSAGSPLTSPGRSRSILRAKDDDACSTSMKSSSSRGSRTSKASRSSSRTKRKLASAKAAPAVPIIPPKPAFLPSMIPAGLSQLGKTADGLRPALLTLAINNTDLSTSDPLADYPHLQTLQLSDNQLTSVASLGSMNSLTSLDVSHNRLTQVLDIRYNSSNVNLRYADYSHNEVLALRDLSAFSRLQSLNLDHNRIEVLTGLSGLGMLRSLSLAHNELKSCKGMDGLHSLRSLQLHSNRLTSLAPLSCVVGLEQLTAADNMIVTLAGVQHLRALRKLDVSGNSIPALEEAAYARDAPLLSDLAMARNPLNQALDVRLHVVHLLPQVTLLDGLPVEAKEKVLAANMHGADAEGLRAIRRRYFPAGELDDGGGATPPTSAGLIASAAEEEVAGGEDSDSASLRVEAWARSVRPAVALQSVNPLVGLADMLASICTGQLQRARVCHEWIVRNVRVPAHDATWRAGVPLFADPAVEVALLSSMAADCGGVSSTAANGGLSDRGSAGISAVAVQGTWAERVAWLFTNLCRACELEAVPINGYWKHLLLPGQRVYAHNHCWAAVKANGRWRLVDCVASMLCPGHLPFFCPPAAFIYSHWPLAEAWQLLPDPVNMEEWWAMAPATLGFFLKGCALPSPAAPAGVVHLPAVREGHVLPSYMLPLAAPIVVGEWLSHRLLDANRQLVATWPTTSCRAEQYAFQQAIAGPRGSINVTAGARVYGSTHHQLWVSPPAPGDWYLEVAHVTHVVGVMRLNVAGLAEPLEPRIVEEDVVLRVKLVLPPILPHDPTDGILHDATTPPCPLPTTHAAFTSAKAQLVLPHPDEPLEADRVTAFNIIVPGAKRVVLAVDVADGQGVEDDMTHQELTVGEDGMSFSGVLQVFRHTSCSLLAQWLDSSTVPASAAPKWQPLLSFGVRPQSQHIVYEPEAAEEVPDIDQGDAVAYSCNEIFKALDVNADGLVTRREALVGFRRNRQHADILRIPARIRAHDGTYDKFVEQFLQIDHSKLGSFGFNELALYMGVKPKHGYGADDEFSEGSSEYDSEEEEGEEEGEEGA